MSVNVLERSVLQAGKTFIRQGEDNIRAYVVQDGEVAAFTINGEQKVEIARFGPGTIIGEKNLMIDEPSPLSYEAIDTTTVVTITRQDFQKRLVRADKSITTILEHAVKKISYYEGIEMAQALERAELDGSAVALARGLVAGLSTDKKEKYEAAILPHLNGLIKELKDLKTRAAD